MPAPVEPPRASFLARVVEAAGGEWSVADDDVYDPGVALDFARNLEPRLGPTVLRVLATSGEFSRVAGDWLCDEAPGPGRHRNARVGPYVWGASLQSSVWAKGRPLLEAWETCGRPSWMTWAAYELGVDTFKIARAAVEAVAAVAGPALDDVGRAELGALAPWARGRDPAPASGIGPPRRDGPAGSFVATLYDAAEATNTSLRASYASMAVRMAGDANSHAAIADALRARITSLDVLRAAVRRGGPAGRRGRP